MRPMNGERERTGRIQIEERPRVWLTPTGLAVLLALVTALVGVGVSANRKANLGDLDKVRDAAAAKAAAVDDRVRQVEIVEARTAAALEGLRLRVDEIRADVKDLKARP